MRSGFQYDPNGNATLFRALSIGYDTENRTVQLPDLYRGGNFLIQSRYRPNGLQAWREDANGRVRFLYDGTRLVAEYSGFNGALYSTSPTLPKGFLNAEAPSIGCSLLTPTAIW